MPDKAGELYVTLKMKATEFERSMARAQKGVKKLEKNTKQLTKSFGVMKTVAIAAATYGLGRLTKSFIDAASASQQYEVRLRVLLRSQKEGTRMFKEMSKYAGKVPFEFSKIMESATALAGVMRGGVDEVVAWMPMIGDLAAATGLGVDIATQQVIRMYSAGAGAADLFRDKGVLAMMGFKAKTAYTAEETRKMMMDAWTKMNSQFRGATDELATTWAGKMSMMQDAWFAFRNAIMLDTGLMEYFETALGYATDFVRQVTEDIKYIQKFGAAAAFQAKYPEAPPPGVGAGPTPEQMAKLVGDAKAVQKQLLDVAVEGGDRIIEAYFAEAKVKADLESEITEMKREESEKRIDLILEERDADLEAAFQAQDAYQRAEIAKTKTKQRQAEQDKKTTLQWYSQSLAMMAQHSKTAFRLYQAYRITETIIETVQASMAAFRWGMTYGGPAAPYLAVAAATAAAAFGAARVAMIASENPNYAEGGIARGPASGYPATLHGTEAVIPLRGGAVPVTISGESGGAVGPMNINLNIYANDALSFLDMTERNPEAILGPLLDALGPSGDRTLRTAVRRRR